MALREFTLDNLLKVLRAHDYKVVGSGPDSRPELSLLRAQVTKLPRPLFFAIIEIEGDLLNILKEMSDALWAEFGRGCMSFDGSSHGKMVRFRITEREDKADG